MELKLERLNVIVGGGEKDSRERRLVEGGCMG